MISTSSPITQIIPVERSKSDFNGDEVEIMVVTSFDFTLHILSLSNQDTSLFNIKRFIGHYDDIIDIQTIVRESQDEEDGTSYSRNELILATNSNHVSSILISSILSFFKFKYIDNCWI